LIGTGLPGHEETSTWFSDAPMPSPWVSKGLLARRIEKMPPFSAPVGARTFVRVQIGEKGIRNLFLAELADALKVMPLHFAVKRINGSESECAG